MSFRSPKYCINYIFFAILIIISVHFIMETGLSYVNSNYCYRTYMNISGNLADNYAVLYNSLQGTCQNVTVSWKY
jgi:hypothetical protein